MLVPQFLFVGLAQYRILKSLARYFELDEFFLEDVLMSRSQVPCLRHDYVRKGRSTTLICIDLKLPHEQSSVFSLQPRCLSLQPESRRSGRTNASRRITWKDRIGVPWMRWLDASNNMCTSRLSDKGLSPGLRQTAKTLLAVRWNCIVQRRGFPTRCALAGEAEALQQVHSAPPCGGKVVTAH